MPAPAQVNVSLDLGDDTHLCPGFAWRTIKGVKNGHSPKWLQQRLIAIGLRPINALVDITNYLTFDRGRPLHVFDADKVEGGLTVRRAREGEQILGLNGKEYTLGPDNVVIADADGVESIGGIMGGEHSGCDENTTNVVVESALWDAMNIARTGRTLGIITDARYRFERGVDPEFMVPGLELATQLVLEILRRHALRRRRSLAIRAIRRRRCSSRHRRSSALPASMLPAETSLDILSRLGFVPQGTGEVVDVVVPSWRPDIDGKADLVEEVMRIHGVDRIDPQPLLSHAAVNGKILTTLQIRTRNARRALASRGMMEAVTWSFISEESAKAFGGGQRELKLANPIAADMSDMRPSLLPGLLAAAQRNADRGLQRSGAVRSFRHL